MSNTTKQITEAIKGAQKSKTSAYDTQAVVRRVEGNIAWVHIPGGVDETPVQMTSNAKEGDTVQVRVSGGKAWLYGNATAPPTDDTVANKGVMLATDANELAASASKAATEAWGFAEDARSAAVTAETHADEAKESADAANVAATSALTGLSIVEDVVGVLNWVSTHATYQLTSDDSVIEGKWYFTYDAVNNRYEVVNNPAGDPSAQGYYEIVSIDEAVQDYLTSHVALNSQGLWLQTDNVASKLLLSSVDGLVIYGDNGPLAKYGNNAVIGDESGFHITIDSTEIGFYQAAQKVAYINGNKLYITQSVVLQQMDVGTQVADGGLGQWSWKVHEVNGQNNLYLKWFG